MTPFRNSGTALRAVATLTTAGLMTLGFSGSAIAEDFKVGIVSFLSGQAADSFGVPAVNGAKVLIEAFNKGKAPASTAPKSRNSCHNRPTSPTPACGVVICRR